MRVIFFGKCSKFNAYSKNAEKNREKIFDFWDKFIWIVCIHLSLLTREYMSWAVNVLREGMKNFQGSKSDFCNSITFTVITQDNKGALIKIESVFLPVYHVACREVLSNGRFSEIYLSASFVVGNFGITLAMRLICFWKCSKCNADSKNKEKKWGKFFCFWEKCIWIVCIHLSLLIREYLSLAVNALRKGLKNIHVSKKDFCNSITLTMITQDDKDALIKIESVFLAVYHVACPEVLSNGSF